MSLSTCICAAHNIYLFDIASAPFLPDFMQWQPRYCPITLWWQLVEITRCTPWTNRVSCSSGPIHCRHWWVSFPSYKVVLLAPWLFPMIVHLHPSLSIFHDILLPQLYVSASVVSISYHSIQVKRMNCLPIWFSWCLSTRRLTLWWHRFQIRIRILDHTQTYGTRL